MATCCEASPQPTFVSSPTTKKQQQSPIVVSVSECVYGEWDGSQDLIDEFRTLQMLTDKPMSFGERILNFPSATTYWTASKNRYPDILPREDTRVRLQHTGCEGSDYINANYVFEKQYIATQAPLFSTFADFWRMVWEQGSCIIVMLTRLTENGNVKANVYWPTTLGEKGTFGMLSVELIHETAFDNIECRLFRISDGVEHRDVYHLHYTGWPDFGVPSSTKEIIDLVKVTNYLRARAGMISCSSCLFASILTRSQVGRSPSLLTAPPALAVSARLLRFTRPCVSSTPPRSPRFSISSSPCANAVTAWFNGKNSMCLFIGSSPTMSVSWGRKLLLPPPTPPRRLPPLLHLLPA